MNTSCRNCARTIETIRSGMHLCPYCGTSNWFGDTTLEQESLIPSQIPWERKEGKTPIGLFTTLSLILFHPGETFRDSEFRNGITTPLIYGIILSSFGTLFSLIYSLVIQQKIGDYISDFAQLPSFSGPGLSIYIVLLPLIPLYTVVALLFNSLTIHFFLHIVKSANRPLKDTICGTAYASASSAIFLVLPIFGSLISWIFETIVTIVAMKEIHRSSYSRIILAFFIPKFVSLLFVISILFALVKAARIL